MVTLTFDLDYDKMKRDGITEEDMLGPMREHAKKYGIVETKKGVFSMDGENALCAIMLFVTDKIDEDYRYISYLKDWILEHNNHIEDCKEEALAIYHEEGIVVA